jgi:hypothetical protein
MNLQVPSMKLLTRILLISFATSLMAAETNFLSRGQLFSEQFLAGDTGGIWNAMTPEMREALESASKFSEFSITVLGRAGEPGQILNEELNEHQGYYIFRQIRSFGKVEQPIVLQWSFDPDGRIAGFYIRPLQRPPSDLYEEYQTRTQLHLPFMGAWHVFWGGRNRSDNYHVDYPNQRYAYDLLVIKGDVSHRGDATKLENYFCWGEPILAPAGGTVLVAEKSHPDQIPGEMDPLNPPGNHVIIDHGHDEYSLLAHMQQGSILVNSGDTVTTGQVIGSCGNSGNTTEPHLHYHLQNDKIFGEGHGLPAPFTDYLVDGKTVKKGVPVKGQIISPTRK